LGRCWSPSRHNWFGERVGSVPARTDEVPKAAGRSPLASADPRGVGPSTGGAPHFVPLTLGYGLRADCQRVQRQRSKVGGMWKDRALRYAHRRSTKRIRVEETVIASTVAFKQWRSRQVCGKCRKRLALNRFSHAPRSQSRRCGVSAVGTDPDGCSPPEGISRCKFCTEKVPWGCLSDRFCSESSECGAGAAAFVRCGT